MPHLDAVIDSWKWGVIPDLKKKITALFGRGPTQLNPKKSSPIYP